MNFLKNLFDRRPKVKAMIEMPTGSLKKIEIKNGKPVVDRELTIPVPVSYGFIPGTLSEDGDPLDIFVISNKYLDTGDLVNVRVIGIFKCTDQGLEDDKVLAILEDEKIDSFEYMVKVANYLMNYKPGFELEDYKRVKNVKDLERYKI